MSLYLDLKQTAERNINKPALYFRKKAYTYGYFLKKVDTYAEIFDKDMQFHKGMVISLCLENSINSLAIIYALNKIGIISNLINPSLPPDEILHFDSLVRSRIIIIEKAIYLKNVNEFASKKEKIALFDGTSNKFIKILRFIKHKKDSKTGIPFKLKNRIKDTFIEVSINENDLAFTAANERFKEEPSLCCFDNKATSSAAFYQKGVLSSIKDSSIALVCGSIMSYSMLISFFHPLLCNNIAISLDYKFKHKIPKNITTLLGDEPNIVSFCNRSEKLIRKVDTIFVYNDFKSAFEFKKKCNVINLFGTVENGGAFAIARKLDGKIALNVYAGNAVCNEGRKLNKNNNLYLSSDANMIGYYKNNIKNDEWVTEKGVKTGYLIFDKLNQDIILKTEQFLDLIFNHSSYYIYYIKEMLKTIPGIIDADISSQDNEHKVVLYVNKNLSSDVIIKASAYLKTQFKKEKISYKLTFLN